MSDNSNLTPLDILPVNKTVVFYSPLEAKDILVRTGTIKDGSCFFHALLHAYSNDYISMNNDGRIKFIKKLRSSIAAQFDKNIWENLSNGVIAKISFQENVNTILSDFYKYIKTPVKDGRTKSVRKVIRNVINESNDKSDIEVYTLITEMLPIDKVFETNILPSAYEKYDKISECKNSILKLSLKFYEKEFEKLISDHGENAIGKNKILLYIKKLEKLIQEIVQEAENSAYTEYIENLYDTTSKVDSYTIGLISEKFNRDIYFIDSRTRLPYIDSTKENLKRRKSIIVMWTDGCHYEIVGRLMAGNRIQREFDHTDLLIKRLYTYLCHPEKISLEYPNLIPYLPKDIRKKVFHNKSSDNEIDNQEDDEKQYEKSSAYEQSDSDHEHIKKLKSNKKVSNKFESSDDSDSTDESI